MSEFKNTHAERTGFRRQLLATVSAIALLGAASESDRAKASDSDRPPFWVELGGQFAEDQNGQDEFLPAFLFTAPHPVFETISPNAAEKMPPSSWDGTAKIAFEPAGTDWVFSAGILYGKSNRSRTSNQQTAQPSHGSYGVFDAYQKITSKGSQSHIVADFRAGKDIGLGMFASGGSSVLSLGVRYAQFSSRNDTQIRSQPTNVNIYIPYHRFYGTFSADRKFTGIGPSLSWDASADLIGNPSESGVTFDWGLNGAILFGRQRTKIHHQTTNEGFMYHATTGNTVIVHHQISQHSASPFRNRQTPVPNLGGFAGVSWRYPSAKVSVGYRADMFFGAMDGGIDAAKKENVGFYGPFASISIGLGG